VTGLHPWLQAALGGVLIGLSAVVLLLLNGRIAGISGIVFGLLERSRAGEWAWKAAFVLGLVASGVALMAWQGVRPLSPASTPVLLLAGLLVGVGTAMGNGCTSGHGVCGLGRLSPRSLVAVLVFMATAIATVFVSRHLLGGA
jgi:uncharacterized membrane protein YedE/YeeE